MSGSSSIHNMSGQYTCLTCRVAFKDAEIQRAHYKTDWHRYNLKRKVAEFPPITAVEFQRRVLIQREKDEAEVQDSSKYCNYCKKSFSCDKSYENHLNSKKHQESYIAALESGQPNQESSAPPSSSKFNKKESKKPNTMVLKPSDVSTKPGVNALSDDSDDSDVEEVDSDEWEEIDGEPIPVNDCLFCKHHSSNLVKNLKHMTVAHSFFIPDVEYVVDMEGLISYLGEKVGEGYLCLWCSGRGKSFYSLEAVRKHMIDKGHTKMLHEGESLAEYVDFYDYSSSYPTDAGDADEEVSIPVLDDSDFSLTLPSGAVIGHRSLMRYYRQNLNPTRAVVPQKGINRLLAHYKALGCATTTPEALQRKARDVEFMKRVQAKSCLKLSTKANKFQKHFRPQVNF
ncbi:hypothetical protein J437_LFUL009769 [Ladona fulva]|uniref:C2H2-type domain-containing protein n=1 Tax=Ladona fulva TaxID=123851 RepID=A0A8K0K9Z6_LADFU|nr:hypothetical protein J437_LFUL009769 [Ladona fulva]